MVRIGPGVDVPYPGPTSAAATKIGRANGRRDTGPELSLRRELHRLGLRYRVDLAVRVGLPRAVKVDVAFTRAQLAVFIDGCFWHSCPEHLHMPKSNRSYWIPKLQANAARDRRVNVAFDDAGWAVLRIWEHEDMSIAAHRVHQSWTQRLRNGRPAGTRLPRR
jgi:DNA mismatch endonuclease, patch repair protein